MKRLCALFLSFLLLVSMICLPSVAVLAGWEETAVSAFSELPVGGKWMGSAYYAKDGIQLKGAGVQSMQSMVYDKPLPASNIEVEFRMDVTPGNWLSVSMMDQPVFNPGNPGAGSGVISLIWVNDGALTVNAYLYQNGAQQGDTVGTLSIPDAGLKAGDTITYGLRSNGNGGYTLSVCGKDMEYGFKELSQIYTDGNTYIAVGADQVPVQDASYLTVTSLNGTAMPQIDPLPEDGYWTGNPNYTESGIQCVSVESRGWIVYDKPVSMNYYTMDVKVDAVPSSWFAVSFMDKPVFNVGDPNGSSGLIALIFVDSDGAKSVSTFQYLNGVQTDAALFLLPKTVKVGDTLTIGMRRYGADFKFSVNGVDVADFAGQNFAAAFAGDKAYPALGYDGGAAEKTSKFTLTSINGEQQPQIDSFPASGNWIGYVQPSSEGVQYANSAASGAIAYDTPLSMTCMSMELRLDKLSSEWISVGFMDKPVFNPGDPSQASGLISLLRIDQNGAVTVDSYLYRDGGEAPAGQISIPDAHVKAGDTLTIGMRRAGAGFVLSVNGVDSTYNGAELLTVYENDLAYVVVGSSDVEGYYAPRFTLPTVMGVSTATAGIQPGTDPGADPAPADPTPGDGLWMGEGVTTVTDGVQLVQNAVGIGGMVYGLEMDASDTSVRLRWDELPTVGEWLAVSFMDKAVFNPGNPASGSGVMTLLSVDAGGALIVSSYLYSGGDEVGGLGISVPRAKITKGSTTALRLRLDNGVPILSVNGLDISGGFTELKDIYPNNKCFVGVGVNAVSASNNSRVTIRHLTGVHASQTPAPGADPGPEPTNPTPCPGNGQWTGAGGRETSAGAQLYFTETGLAGLVYDMPVKLTDTSIRIKLNHIPANGEWLAVSYMNKIVFNPGDPKAASGIIVLLRVDRNGGLTATAYVYKDGTEVPVTELSLPLAGIETDGIVQLALKSTTTGYTLTVNGQAMDSDFSVLKGVCKDDLAFPAVGVNSLSSIDGPRYTIVNLTGLYSADWQPGDEDPVMDTQISPLPSGGVWTGPLQNGKDGVEYHNPLAGMDALIYNKALSMDNAEVKVRIDQNPQKMDWICVNFMDKAVFNPGTPSMASGLFSLLLVDKNGALTVNSYLYKDGQEAGVGQLIISDANIKAGSVITVAMRKTSNGYALYINGQRMQADLSELKSVFKDGKAYVIVGLNSQEAINSSRFTVMSLNGKKASGVAQQQQSNGPAGDLGEIVDNPLLPPPEDGKWEGLITYTDDGVGYLNERGGLDGILYTKPLSMKNTTVDVMIGKMPEADEWFCVNFMEMPIFNPGDPATASGVLTLLYIDQNGGLTANVYVYKDGQEEIVGQLVLADANIKVGDIIRVRICETKNGYGLIINDVRVPAVLSDLEGVFVNGEGYPVVGAFTHVGYAKPRFTVTSLNGVKPVAPEDEKTDSTSSSDKTPAINSNSDLPDDSSGSLLWLIWLLAGLVVTAAVVAVVLLVVKNKKSGKQ